MCAHTPRHTHRHTYTGTHHTQRHTWRDTYLHTHTHTGPGVSPRREGPPLTTSSATTETLPGRPHRNRLRTRQVPYSIHDRPLLICPQVLESVPIPTSRSLWAPPTGPNTIRIYPQHLFQPSRPSPMYHDPSPFSAQMHLPPPLPRLLNRVNSCSSFKTQLKYPLPWAGCSLPWLASHLSVSPPSVPPNWIQRSAGHGPVFPAAQGGPWRLSGEQPRERMASVGHLEETLAGTPSGLGHIQGMRGCARPGQAWASRTVFARPQPRPQRTR